MIDYENRDELLVALGWSTYDEYLLSQRWAKIRRRVLLANNMQCVVCGEPASQVHHLRYDKATLLGKDLDGLVSICPTCHHLLEYDTSGKKRTPQEANAALSHIQQFANSPRKTKHNKLHSSTRTPKHRGTKKPKTSGISKSNLTRSNLLLQSEELLKEMSRKRNKTNRQFPWMFCLRHSRLTTKERGLIPSIKMVDPQNVFTLRHSHGALAHSNTSPEIQGTRASRSDNQITHGQDIKSSIPCGGQSPIKDDHAVVPS